VPLYHGNFLKSDFVKKDPAIVDYIILKEISNITIANTGGKNAVSRADADRIDVKKPVAPVTTTAQTPKAQARHTRSEYLKRFEAAKLREKARQIASSRESDKNDAAIRSTKDYQDYYGFLKDKIRTRLQENYKFYKGEGDVYVSFVLGSKGQLVSYAIDRAKSVKDEVLLHITGTSLMAVSPFPPLPKIISQPFMSFSITISFKK
jgi:hypothetical protein